MSVGALTVIVPVVTEHVGCVTLTVGADGAAVRIVTLLDGDIHPAALFAVTLYLPAITEVNIPVVLVYVVLSIL